MIHLVMSWWIWKQTFPTYILLWYVRIANRFWICWSTMFKWPKNQILNAILSFRSSGMSGHSTRGIYGVYCSNSAKINFHDPFWNHFESILTCLRLSSFGPLIFWCMMKFRFLGILNILYLQVDWLIDAFEWEDLVPNPCGSSVLPLQPPTCPPGTHTYTGTELHVCLQINIYITIFSCLRF